MEVDGPTGWRAPGMDQAVGSGAFGGKTLPLGQILPLRHLFPL
jgi:hypothetical protein